MNPGTVTHPSTNGARHRLTSLIETNALPLRETATVRGSTQVRHCCTPSQVNCLHRCVSVIKRHNGVNNLPNIVRSNASPESNRDLTIAIPMPHCRASTPPEICTANSQNNLKGDSRLWKRCGVMIRRVSSAQDDEREASAMSCVAQLTPMMTVSRLSLLSC